MIMLRMITESTCYHHPENFVQFEFHHHHYQKHTSLEFAQYVTSYLF